MSSKEIEKKSSLVGTVDEFLAAKKRELAESSGLAVGDVEFINILEFVDRFQLLPNGLYPVQKFILKLYYNLELDSENKTIIITDKFNEKVISTLTETEYLEYLFEHRRCNVKKQSSSIKRQLILCIGRRGGKSEISSIICAYESYKLLCRGDPQAYYGMPGGSEIRVLCVANDKEQASIVYGNMQGYITSVDYFKSSLVNDTMSFMKFRTDSDRNKFASYPKKGTITASFKSSIAKGLRGRGVICCVLDEIAFFVDDGKSSASKVYKAIDPSLAQFSPKDPVTHRPREGCSSDGRMVLISSPDAKEGFFYRQFEQAMSGGPESENILVIQAPTWEVNPTISSAYLRGKYYEDPNNFDTEYGALFSDRVRGYIETASDLIDCVNPTLKPSYRGAPRDVHFAGIDFGISNDGTAISLTRLNDRKIELSYHEVWYPGISWKEANPHLIEPINPYCLTLREQARLDIEEIVNWFFLLSKLFYIHKGVFDQHAGGIFEQQLHKKGLQQFEMKNFFASDSSQFYQNFKMCMYSNKLTLYDYPNTVDTDPSKRRSPLIQELLELQQTKTGKNLISVEAPKIPGKHDDVSDSLVRSVWLATDYIKENPGILDASSMRLADRSHGAYMSSGNYDTYHRSRQRIHGVERTRNPRLSRKMR